MVVKVAGWLLPVICRCRCQNAGYASFIKFVYHRRGNVQNAAIFQSQQLMNRGIYIYTDTVATTQQMPYSDMQVVREESRAEFADKSCRPVRVG